MTGLLILGETPSSLWAGWNHQSPVLETSDVNRFPVERLVETADGMVERIADIELYEDLNYGFTVAVPVGWTRIVAADALESSSDERLDESSVSQSTSVRPEPESLVLEPGYAVGFESASRELDDPFTDYILIEILPGKDSGLFQADLAQRRYITVDDHRASLDRIEISRENSDLTDVDLIVYQSEFSGLGYTVGLYAIGELIREPLLAMAFAVMLQTFEVKQDPFPLS